MASLNRSAPKARPAAQRATTLEMVRHACPDGSQAQRISESFGLAAVDSDGIRELHRAQLIESAAALKDGLAEKAMQIHMQRIVGSFVGSAYGAGQFYSRSVTEARDLTCKLSNDDRDEDLEGPVDDIAERVTALGGVARGTARIAAATSRIKELPHDGFDGIKVVALLADRYATLAASTRVAIGNAADAGDADTSDLFTGVSRCLDKALWFLEAHLQ